MVHQKFLYLYTVTKHSDWRFCEHSLGGVGWVNKKRDEKKKIINDDEQQIFLWTYSHSASCFTYCAQYLRRRYLNFSFVSFLFFRAKATVKIKYGEKSLQIKSFNIITFRVLCSKISPLPLFFPFSCSFSP